MNNGHSLFSVLGHYCDTVWEYDCERDMIYIHYGKLLPELCGSWRTASELLSMFRERCTVIEEDQPWGYLLSRNYFEKFLKNGAESQDLKLRFHYHAQEHIWYSLHIEAISDRQLIITGRDISDEINAHALVSSLNRSFDRIIIIDITNGTYIINYSNSPNFTTTDPRNYHDRVRELVDELAAECDPEELFRSLSLDAVRRSLAGESEYTVFVTCKSDGGILSYKRLTYSYFDNTEQFITLSVLDINGIVRRYENVIDDLSREGFRDRLTGAYNRNFYEVKMKNAPLTGSVAVIDIDDFKLCNDTLGHGAGDRALIALSDKIVSCIGDTNRLVRYGGDEFLIVLPDIADEDKLYSLLERIRIRVREMRIPELGRHSLTVSIGAVISHGESIAEAVFRADRYMYRAKKSKNMTVIERKGGSDSTAAEMKDDEPKQQILIVDDSELNRAILSDILRDDFSILEASDGNEGIALLRQYGTGISLVLLDVIMPSKDGFDVLTEMNRDHIIDDIPVVIISADNSIENIRRAFELGVTDYISRPFDSKIVRQRVVNTMLLYSKQRRLISLLSQKDRERDREDRMLIDIMGRIVGLRNGESESHMQHIRCITSLILDQLCRKTDKYHLTSDDCAKISLAASLHDIGKMGIDDRILNKVGSLTEEEFAVMKTHTVIGENMLRGLDVYGDEPLLRTAAEICRWHHERWDGKGYPDGLSGDDIPIAAQVVSLADVYDALMSERTYKKAYSTEDARNMIRDGSCGMFNPLLIECCNEIWDALDSGIYGSEYSGHGNIPSEV